MAAAVTDGANTTKTNNYKVSTKGSASTSLTFDANGNMTSDGTNTYERDAENRLTKITYPGTGNFTSLAYDGLGRNVSIVETTLGSVTSTKHFIWCFGGRQEERDGSGSVTKRNFSRGQITMSTNTFFTKDHLGSIRETTNTTGSILAGLSYDMFGRLLQFAGSQSPDFSFDGCLYHQRSNLTLAIFREYSPVLGRFLSRDPIGESGGVNLAAFVENRPSNSKDPLGLEFRYPPGVPLNNCAGYSCGEHRTSDAPYGTHTEPSSGETFGKYYEKDRKLKCDVMPATGCPCNTSVVYFLYGPPSLNPGGDVTESTGETPGLAWHEYGYNVPVGEGGEAVDGWSQIPGPTSTWQKPKEAPLPQDWTPPEGSSIWGAFCCHK